MQIKLSSILLCLLLVCACEKLDTNPEGSSAQQNDNHPTLTVSDILNGDFEADTEIWLSGYIVGYVNGSSMSSAKFATGNKATNILLADSPFETSYKNCVPVQLSNSSAEKENVRKALNLSSQPSNLGRKVKVLGTITNYMSTNGITKTILYEFLTDDFDYDKYYREHQNTENADNTENNNNSDEVMQFDDEDDEWPDEDETIDDGTGDNNGEGNSTGDNDGNNDDGTSDSDTNTNLEILAKTQFTVAEIIGSVTTAMQQEGITSMPYCKVKGYIVGFVSGTDISSTSFTSANAKETNIVLADSPNETDYTKCIAVQLSTSSSYKATRDALNLKANPSNLGKSVIIKGTIETYMGRLGLKYTSSYTFE